MGGAEDLNLELYGIVRPNKFCLNRIMAVLNTNNNFLIDVISIIYT